MLAEPSDNWDCILIYLIRTKLDKTTAKAWKQVNKAADKKTCHV